MSLDDFEARAGLDLTIRLHCTHSLPPATTTDARMRVPLQPKSHNSLIPIRANAAAKRKPLKPVLPALTISPPRASNISILDDHSPETPDTPSLSLSAVSTPCTPFQLPPIALTTSPFRLPSFLDLAIQKATDDDKPEPKPTTPRQLCVDLPSVAHPNSPYVPWASPVRRQILRPLSPASQVSRYSRPYSRSGARAPEPQEVDEDEPPQTSVVAPAPSRLLRLSRSLKNLKKTLKHGVKHVKDALGKSSKAKTTVPPLPVPITPPPTTPLPIPSPSVASCDTTKTNTLSDWLRDCAVNLERATPNYMTLEEYEERGSWREREGMHSPALTDATSPSQRVRSPSPSPGPISISPSATSDVFPRLSMLEAWPAPPTSCSVPENWNSASRDRMPGGWD